MVITKYQVNVFISVGFYKRACTVRILKHTEFEDSKTSHSLLTAFVINLIHQILTEIL